VKVFSCKNLGICQTNTVFETNKRFVYESVLLFASYHYRERFCHTVAQAPLATTWGCGSLAIAVLPNKLSRVMPRWYCKQINSSAVV